MSGGAAGAAYPAIVSTTILERQVITTVMPAYPDALREAGAGGDVSVFVTVGPDGEVKNLTFLEGDPRLTEVTLQALKKWRFKPLEGAPLGMSGTLDFRYEPQTGLVSVNPKLGDVLNQVAMPAARNPKSSSH